MDTVIIVIIIVIIIIVIIRKIKIQGHKEYEKYKEHYDERLRDTTFEQCAKFCKTTAGCYAFGYNRQAQVCYPSRSTLTGRPLDPNILFKDYYTPQDSICNKIDPIIQPGKDISFDKRRANSIDVCTEREGLHPQWYLHSHDEFINVGEGKNIDEIFDIDDYAVNAYRWPVNKYDINNLDLLTHDRSVQNIIQSEVTDINRIEQPPRIVATPPRQVQIAAPQTSQSSLNFDFGLNRIKSMLGNNNNKTEQFDLVGSLGNILRPNNQATQDQTVQVQDALNTNVTAEDGVAGLYTVYNDYNDGEYLKKYKCVDGISQKSCLSYCSLNDACNGAEWNPYFGLRYNVCCPKRSVGTFLPRVWMHRLGKFYLKNNSNNKNLSYIT